MSEYSWRGNLGRTGGFYQDADWYSANLRRKVTPHRHQCNKLYNLVQMPLVGKMMEELVAALPPLADSKVVFLAPTGALIVIVVYHTTSAAAAGHFLRFRAFLPIYLVFLFEN